MVVLTQTEENRKKVIRSCLILLSLIAWSLVQCLQFPTWFQEI